MQESCQTLSKWQSYVDLGQILQDLGMHAWAQSMFNLNTHDPGTECFTPGMRDLVLMHAPSASFGSLMAILAPYAGHHISNVTMMVASLGEAESQQQQKGV